MYKFLEWKRKVSQSKNGNPGYNKNLEFFKKECIITRDLTGISLEFSACLEPPIKPIKKFENAVK
jgi:hypothetical protein